MFTIHDNFLQTVFCTNSNLTKMLEHQLFRNVNDPSRRMKNEAHERKLMSNFCFSLLSFSKWFLPASVSVRNIRIPKVPLTVKPDPNDTLNRSLNGAIGSNTNNYYYDSNNYTKPSDEVNSLYINGQAPHQGLSVHQDQYAVVKKTGGSKRDIRENLDRETIFKVSSSAYYWLTSMLPWS